MAYTLTGYTKVCIISFIDIYPKLTYNFPEARPVTKNEQISIGKEFARIGKQYNITIKSCGEGDILAPYGVDCE